MKKIEKTTLIYGAILASLIALSLYIKALPYDSVFNGVFVRFSGNDPWYNMRLVDSTLHHFPHRIYFDAFTYYPHGTPVPYAPLFDYALAVIIWLIGLGNPYATLGVHGIDAIGAWYPAVLGAIVVIPVYFIGKALWNRNAGLLSAALIAILPGQFLSRSLLGFTDHHIAETLFSTITMLFLILAVQSAKKHELTFYSVLDKDWSSLKKPLLYSFFGGIFFGCYYLSWYGAPLFVFILLIYAVVQYIIDHVRGETTDYLCIISIPLLFVPMIMIAPLLHPGALSSFQVISLAIGMVVFVFLSAISFLMNYKKIAPYGYPIAILVLGVLSFALLYALVPSLYSSLTGNLRIFLPTETQLTVAEIHPMTIREAWGWFSTTFFIAFFGFAWLGYEIARKFRAEEILFVVWSAVMQSACWNPITGGGQNRFAYYYAVNAALLCGFVSWKLIELFTGLREGEEPSRRVKGKKKGGTVVQKAKSRAKSKTMRKEEQTKAKKITQYLRAELIITAIVIGVVVFYPPLTTSLATAKYGGGPEYDWYESLAWMRNNTPEPGVSYYALYKTPPVNRTTGRIEDYNYPEEAYSVISWWDYGNWIMRIAHRIPVANPFQQGIGGPIGSGKPGACVFFVTTDKTSASEVADVLGVRYVVSDFMMADVWSSFYNKYAAMTVWAGNFQKYNTLPYYYNTMEARLHVFDGTRTEDVEGENISALAQYRLVHESPTFILPLIIMNESTGSGFWTHISGNYNLTASQARILHGFLFSMPVGMGIEEMLDKGVLPEMLKSALVNTTGLPISPNTTVVKGGKGNWIIQDEKNKNTFMVTKKDGKLNVYLYGIRTGQPNMRAWTPDYIEPMSFVKVFEYVKGARIVGTAPNGTIVEIATNISTNQGRKFGYATQTMSNGTYEFVVPYSTEGPVEGGTNFDVFASPYKLRAGPPGEENATVKWTVQKEVHVPEEAVMDGETIKVDLLALP